jgi:acetyl esterase
MNSLHPQVVALRERIRRDGVPHLSTLSIDQARAADRAAIMAGTGQTESVAVVKEMTLPGPSGELRARMYRPGGGAGLPVLVYYFGGGWSLGTLDAGEGVCRMLANAVGCVTIAVEYRLAPEHPFPAAVEDCYAGAAWAAAHAGELGGDATRLAVGGDSSGGNLAAAVALLSRDRGGPAITHQLLVYPNTDYQADTPSMRELNDEYFFNPASVRWYWGMYLATPEDGTNPLASPLRADDLSGLPAATVITAEYDPLRDEADAYAARLRADGVPAEIIRYTGMIHGFFTMTGVLDTARVAVLTAADRLRTAFSPPVSTRDAMGQPS